MLLEQADERDNRRLEKSLHEKEYACLHMYITCNNTDHCIS